MSRRGQPLGGTPLGPEAQAQINAMLLQDYVARVDAALERLARKVSR